MKIEKISDTQIKFILSQDDLSDKDIKLEDLAISNDKTKDLFQDILAKALDEFGFAIDDAPLMVEALPVAMDSIMIIVTKLESDKTDSNDPNELPNNIIAKDLHRYKRNSIIVRNSDSSDCSNIIIYSFSSLNDVISACLRINAGKFDSSSLYKVNNNYCLILSSKNSIDDNSEFLYILNEYGNKYNSNVLAKYHIMEQGEKIISENAIEILAENFV